MKKSHIHVYASYPASPLAFTACQPSGCVTGTRCTRGCHGPLSHTLLIWFVPAGGGPLGSGVEFGRSRRLCAEEEREKKNVSFAPSVHQIEFDLDEEEEDEEEEEEEEEEDREDVGDARLRQLQPIRPSPLQGASWLREKLVSVELGFA